MELSTLAISNLLFDRFLSDFARHPRLQRQQSLNRRREAQKDFEVPFHAAETKDSLCLSWDIPGVRREDLSLTVTSRQIEITGTRATSSKGELLRRERWSGEFSWALKLPFPIDTEKVEATYARGVLTVTIAKTKVAQEKRIEIKVAE